MNHILASNLTAAVVQHLNQLDMIVPSADAASLVALAGLEMPRLTTMLRDALATHPTDIRGHCRTCSGPWPRRRISCQLLITLNTRITTQDHSDKPQSKHALRDAAPTASPHA